MSTKTRPSQVTFAGWAAIVAGVLLVMSVFETAGQLRTVRFAEQVGEALQTGAASGLGLTVDEAIEAIRIGLFVSGFAAAAAAIFAFFVLRGDRGARVGLSVAAVPVLVTAPLSGGLLSGILGASAVMMWTGQARAWMAGKPLPERGSPAAPPALDPTALPTAEPTPPGAPAGAPGEPPATQPATPPAGSRPGAVAAAAIITWISTGFIALMYAGVLLVAVAAPDPLLDAVEETQRLPDGVSRDSLIPILIGASIAVIAWCLSAAVAAVFVWRGHTWAWITLTLLAASAGLFSLLGFPWTFPVTVAAVATVVLLQGSAGRAWFLRLGHTWRHDRSDGSPGAPR